MEGQITMTDPIAIALLVAVALLLLLPRLLPRLLVGLRSFISPLELKRRLDAGEKLLVLDVRTPGEFHQAHIPGAVNIPLVKLPPQPSGRVLYDPDTAVVTVCQTDLRAGLAARKLRRMGFGRVWVLSGGMNNWSSDHLPTE